MPAIKWFSFRGLRFLIFLWLSISVYVSFRLLVTDASSADRSLGSALNSIGRRVERFVVADDKPVAEVLRAREQDSEFKGELPQIGAPEKLVFGDMGAAVKVDVEGLNSTEKQKYDRLWKENAFNGYASDLISLHRRLPDMRDIECRRLHYDLSLLPSSSVIVIFHNEQNSALLRTVHSVIDNSPAELLKEVILVDDCSTRDYLQSPLDRYISTNFDGKVKLVRLKTRQGLIRARLAGADEAKGEILIFLDSHCEATTGWLEPLLYTIAQNNRTAVVPIIETIDDTTLAVSGSRIESTQVGGFTWNLIFNWHGVPKQEMERRKNRTEGIRTPTMAGGLFAISKAWFEHLGRYDDGMDVWGGENMEISFKVWMCGGVLETCPCSHVGHIFRKRSPYKWPSGGNVLVRNTMRVAKVWLDDFYKYYLEKVGESMDKPEVHGDLTKRIELRRRLQCHDFRWFHENVYPELFVPGDCPRGGEIRNSAEPFCVDSSTRSSNIPVIAYPCHGKLGNQLWYFTRLNEIRRDDMCVDYAGGPHNQEEKSVTTYACHGTGGNQAWEFKLVVDDNKNKTKGRLKHSSGLCLSLTTETHKLVMEECDSLNPRQVWQWNERNVRK